MILINRKTRTSVVVLTNSSTGEVDRLAKDIMKMMAGAKVAPRKLERTIKVPAKDLQKFVGRYELVPGIEFAVMAKGGKLMVSLTGQPAYEIFARSESVWFYKVVDATITFKIDKNGRCNSLELFQLGKKQTAKRVK